jgi:putative peptidoglycan lipid II flippase
LIARHAAEKNFAGMAEDYRKGLRLILIINVPAAVGLVVLSEPIVRLLFQHGRFTATDTHAMAPLLALFAVGMPFFSVVSLTTRAFYAAKDTVTPVKAATISFVINVGLSWWLKNVWGAPGLVFASTFAIVVQTLVLQRLLARRIPGMHFGALWPTLAKVLLGAVIMGGLVAVGWWKVRTTVASIRTADLVAVLAMIPLGGILYAVTLWLVRVEGREEFTALVQRLRGKISGSNRA